VTREVLEGRMQPEPEAVRAAGRLLVLLPVGVVTGGASGHALWLLGQAIGRAVV
jgi:hypothetical protein